MFRLTMLILSASVFANASTRYVNNADASCGGHSPCYTTIQAAVKAAVAGDDLRIQFGTGVYDEQVTTQSSGTSSSPITIESDNSSNQPSLRYTGNGSLNGMFTIANHNYWTIQNLTFDGTGVWTSRSALVVRGDNWYRNISSDQVGIKILNNVFKNWGGTESQASSEYSSTGYGPVALEIQGGYGPASLNYLPNGTVISGNLFDSNRMINVEMTSSKNSVVKDNEIRNSTCGIEASGGGGTAVTVDGFHIISGTTGVGSGDLFQHNTIHDFQSPSSCGLSPSGGGAYNEWDALHCDVGPANGIVDGNLIYNIDPKNARPGGGGTSTGLHIEAQCYGWVSRNNVIHDVGFDGILNNQQTGSGTRNGYYNNTIYNIANNGIELRYGYADVENNIIDNSASVQMWVRSGAISSGNITIDYNEYWDLSGGNKVGSWNNGAVGNFASWKTSCGCDSHSLNATPNLSDPAGGVFAETSNSPTIDKGISLSQVTTDQTGATFNPRDDIGAYEYGSGGGAPPAAPSNLTAIVQ